MNAAQIASTKANNSIIERALAAARARKAAAEGAAAEAPDAEVETEVAVEKPSKAKPKAKAPVEDKAATKAARDAERAAKKLQMEAEREARRAAREANKADKAVKESTTEKKLAHMKKVEKARAKLPSLTDLAQRIFGDATANLSAVQLDALALHLQHHNRETATIRANALPPLPLGATVRITGGDPKFIGMTGKVIHSQKLRAKVEVPGFTKEVYIYNGQAEVVADSLAEAV